MQFQAPMSIKQQSREEAELQIVRYLIEPCTKNVLCLLPFMPQLNSCPKRPRAITTAMKALGSWNRLKGTTAHPVVELFWQWWQIKHSRALLRALYFEARPPCPNHLEVAKMEALENQIKAIYRGANYRLPKFQ